VNGSVERLAIADRLLRDGSTSLPGRWPRCCAWLLRLALEHALADLWAARCPEAAASTMRAQLLVLPRFVPADLATRVAQLWATLSRAAHHHAYELEPTAAELRSWHHDVTAVATELAACR